MKVNLSNYCPFALFDKRANLYKVNYLPQNPFSGWESTTVPRYLIILTLLEDIYEKITIIVQIVIRLIFPL